MEEYILSEYLSKGKMSDREFVNRMKEALGDTSYRARGRKRPMMRDSRNYDWNDYNRHSDHELQDMIDDMSNEDRTKLLFMLDHRHSEEINGQEAKHIVSDMWHIANGKKYVGEKFTMEKAHEVFNKYRSVLDDYTVPDVYIAINAQYHDYCDLFKTWFGDNIDNKIIESAIKFWFKDVDYQGGNKVYKYFMES